MTLGTSTRAPESGSTGTTITEHLVSEPHLLQRFRLPDLDSIRPTLIDLYLELYAADRNSGFFTRERFSERLADHAGPGWEAVVGYDQGHAFGYAYGCPLPQDTVWWEGAEPTPPDDVTAEDGRRTFALLQLMVGTRWRGSGIARQLHDELLRKRSEERVTLLVECDHPKVRGLYEQWGYQSVAQSHPYPDGPLYDIMLRSHTRHP
jgi:GNAT superfamily N-acetyltransferase